MFEHSVPEIWPFILGGLGLIVGSFCGLVSIRLPAGEPFALSRSRCRTCRRALAPPDLVPIASWLASGGRCRVCHAPIGVRYPALELAGLTIGVWAGWAEPNLQGVLGAVMGWQLVLIAWIDAEHQWLPNALTGLLATTGLVAAALTVPEALLARGLGAVLGFGALWVLARGYRRLRGHEGLGGGDPKLLGAVGAWLGWAALPTVVVAACAIGLVVALIRRPRRGEAQRLPFGTFLALGAWLVWALEAGGPG